MRKAVTLFVAIALFSILFSVFYSFAEERITLTTYYPAPYGVYKDMRTNTLAVGSSYRGSSPENGQLFVQDRVGINTSSAFTTNDRLTIREGDISVYGTSAAARKLNIVSSNGHAGIEIFAKPGSAAYIDFSEGVFPSNPDYGMRLRVHNNNLLNITGGNVEVRGNMVLGGSGRKLQINSGTPGAGDEIFISDGAPQIQFEDTTAGHDDFWIHVNEGRMYFLWDKDDDGDWDAPHPLYFAGRNAYFGGKVEVAGTLQAGPTQVNGVLEAKSALVVTGDLSALGNTRATCAWTDWYWCDDDKNYNYVICPAQRYVAGFAPLDFDSHGYCHFKLYCCDL